MKLNAVHILVTFVKVSVHNVDSKEESLVFALEGGKHLDHPVDHFSSVGSVDLVTSHVILLNGVLVHQFSHIGIDFPAIVRNQIHLKSLLG